MKNKLAKLMIYFTLYSVLGWIYEIFLEVVVYRWGYADRGVLFIIFMVDLAATVITKLILK